MTRLSLSISVLVAALITSTAEQAVATEPALPPAIRLVNLIKPHEREMLALRFMVTVSPIPLPEGIADCSVAKATPALKEYFARLYATELDERELGEAVVFFESNEGQSAVSLRLQHDQNIYTAAAKGQTIDSEDPHYPTQVQKALDSFGATVAGKAFIGKDELISRQPFRREISGLRDSALGDCIRELAAGEKRGS